MMLTRIARGLGILFVLFVGVFALDLFGAGYSAGELAVGLFMHLLPSFALLGVLLLAWFRPLWGAAAYAALGVGFTLFFHTYREPMSFLFISGPAFLLAGLFYWSTRKERAE